MFNEWQKLNEFCCKHVIVCLHHKIFGVSKHDIECFSPIVESERLGFSACGSDVFLLPDEVVNVLFEKNRAKIVGTYLTIKVKLL